MNTTTNTDAHSSTSVRIGGYSKFQTESKPAQGRWAVRVALAALACLITAPALALPAVPFLPAPRDVCRIQIPPARYNRVPNLSMDGPHYVPASQVARECRQSGEDSAVGCTTTVGLRGAKGFHPIAFRVVIADRPTAGNDPRCTVAKWRASILRHERAHAAGWPADHPR